jgi:hypothetical protein
MTLTAGGNLGIGTSTPTSRLEVNGGTTNADVTLTLSSSGTYSSFIQMNGANSIINGASNLRFRVGGTDFMRLDSSGNLGLGVTPSAWSGHKAIEMAVGRGFIASSDSAFRAYVGYNAYNNSGWKYAASTSAALYEQADSKHIWFTAPSGTAGNAISFTQAMTLTAGGSLGIGTTTPEVNARLTLDRTDSNFIMLRASGVNKLSLYCDAGISAVDGQTNPLAFFTNATERARIDSSGNLLIGRTTAPVTNTAGAAIQSTGLIITESSQTQGGLWVNRITSDGNAVYFTRDNVLVGAISVTGSATTYATSSDYRLKNTIAPMTGALEKVALLKPCTYKWNADGSDGEGFIAHELAEVVPQCVTGQKDAVDAEGKPQYQGIDTSFLVATLTAAIQEQQAIINSLKARLDAANL